MKYCVSGKQPKEILEQADEIKFSINDIGRFIDTIEILPDKTYIIEIPKDKETIDWPLLQAYAQKVQLILCIQNLNMAKNCHQFGIPFYWSYPVFSWYELRGLIALNPCYIILSAPLSFSLDKVANATLIPIRLCPNLAYDAYIPRENGIYGTWVRPEDVEVYEQWVRTFEFITDDLGKERTLFNIYKNDRNWPGNLNLLLTNLNINVDNRAIPKEIGKIRATCAQKCMENGHCKFCKTAMNFSNSIRKYHYKLKQNSI